MLNVNMAPQFIKGFELEILPLVPWTFGVHPGKMMLSSLARSKHVTETFTIILQALFLSHNNIIS